MFLVFHFKIEKDTEAEIIWLGICCYEEDKCVDQHGREVDGMWDFGYKDQQYGYNECLDYNFRRRARTMSIKDRIDFK